eukprot:8775103-Alexandrium_andersonii.AAC.1
MCIRDRSGGAVAPPVRPLAPEAPSGEVRGGGSPPRRGSRNEKDVFTTRKHVFFTYLPPQSLGGR